MMCNQSVKSSAIKVHFLEELYVVYTMICQLKDLDKFPFGTVMYSVYFIFIFC